MPKTKTRDDQREHETDNKQVAIERALSTHVGTPEDVKNLVAPQIAVTAVHVPGTALERKDDRDASAAQHAEATEGEALERVEYLGIDTKTPEGNYLTRSNIVPSEASPHEVQARVRAAADDDARASVSEAAAQLSGTELADALLPTDE